MSKRKAISLFSGGGAFCLGASLAGFDIIAQVEIDEYCRKVLAKHHDQYWANSTRFADVRDFGIKQFPAGYGVDLIFGGFPCQPFSVAGKHAGKDDSRYLWHEFARVIGELLPRTVVLENVPNIVNLGGTDVIADLTRMGYDCRWGTISASDAGAPHKRLRWWCVAYLNAHGLEARKSQERQNPHDAQRVNPLNPRRQKVHVTRRAGDSTKTLQSRASDKGHGHEPGLVRNADGTTYRLDEHRFPNRPFEQPRADEPPRFVPRKASPNWVARVQLLGNALVPQVAYALLHEVMVKLDEMDGVA